MCSVEADRDENTASGGPRSVAHKVVTGHADPCSIWVKVEARRKSIVFLTGASRQILHGQLTGEFDHHMVEGGDWW